MSISYIPKINKRIIGQEFFISNEPHTVGVIGVGTMESGSVHLTEVPLQENPSSILIPGFIEVSNAPGPGQFLVDYANGFITFDSSEDGTSISVSYKGRGSIVRSEDINELQGPVGVALEFDGSLAAGIVKAVNIAQTDPATFPPNTFTFPNMLITGDLTVQGTTTTVNTQTLLVADNIIEVNYGVSGPPSLDGGLQVDRGASPNVQFLWNETNDSWQLKDEAGNAILEAFSATDNVTILGALSAASLGLTGDITANSLKLNDGSVSAPSLAYQSDTNTGFYRKAADSVGFAAGGNMVAYWDASSITISQPLLSFNNAQSIGSVSNYFNQILMADGSASAPSYTFGLHTNTGIFTELAGGNNVVSFASAGVRSAFVTPSGLCVGVGASSAGSTALYNAGSTVLTLTSATNPGSIPTSDVDTFSGSTILATVTTSISIGSPTFTGAGRIFTVLSHPTSLASLTVNTVPIPAGRGVTFVWNGSAWEATTGGSNFNTVAGTPPGPGTGQVWFDTTDNQFKGYNGTSVVILG